MNTLLLLNIATACPLSWRFQSEHFGNIAPGAVCKLNTQYYTHEEFIGVMCENSAFLKMIANSPGHDRRVFKCDTVHVKVEHSEKTKKKFSYNHCVRDELEVRKVAKFNNHETDKFCQRYSEQFDYTHVKLHQIANLCKPYYVSDDGLNDNVSSPSEENKEWKRKANQECCHQRLQDHMARHNRYTMDCQGYHRLTKTVDGDALEKHIFIITYGNGHQTRLAVQAYNINGCSLHIR